MSIDPNQTLMLSTIAASILAYAANTPERELRRYSGRDVVELQETRGAQSSQLARKSTLECMMHLSALAFVVSAGLALTLLVSLPPTDVYTVTDAGMLQPIRAYTEAEPGYTVGVEKALVWAIGLGTGFLAIALLGTTSMALVDASDLVAGSWLARKGRRHAARAEEKREEERQTDD